MVCSHGSVVLGDINLFRKQLTGSLVSPITLHNNHNLYKLTTLKFHKPVKLTSVHKHVHVHVHVVVNCKYYITSY